ncbi:MAG: phosphodiester glycosidase family protein [Chloroflexi bacterium]|nr:phosphodiester glycosidase family protein [Chloroflexota bacterium]
MSCKWAGYKLQVGGIVVVLMMVLGGCTAVTPSPPPPITLSPHPPITPSPPKPDSGWQDIHPGLEQRTIRLFNEEGRQIEEISIFRLQPDFYEFAIAYRPGEPQLLSDWQTETGALLLLNGGFFMEDYVATGLTVVDGQAHGRSYDEFAGMFAVTGAGPEVRWLGTRPYNPHEPLNYALQSFPMLLKPGGQIGYLEVDVDKARRTVVGQDGDGRILFIIAPWGSFTLHELSLWLVNSDLNLDVALNLDGGTSSGLLLAEPEQKIPSFTRLPLVITIFPKEVIE